MCETHRLAQRRRDEEGRPSATERMYDSKWRKARAEHFAEHPYCVECHKRGRTVMATHVDHSVPHKGDRDLFWDKAHWQSLCAYHHNSKTAAQDGGFGNPVK